MISYQLYRIEREQKKSANILYRIQRRKGFAFLVGSLWVGIHLPVLSGLLV